MGISCRDDHGWIMRGYGPTKLDHVQLITTLLRTSEHFQHASFTSFCAVSTCFHQENFFMVHTEDPWQKLLSLSIMFLDRSEVSGPR